MIREDKFYGRARTLETLVGNHYVPAGYRLYTYSAASPRTLFLPRIDNAIYVVGGPPIYILNKGAATLTIANNDNTQTVTAGLTSGKIAIVTLLNKSEFGGEDAGGGSWVARVKTATASLGW